MTKISPFGRYYAPDSNGAPLAGGKLYTYVAGTTTPKATYTTNTNSSANTNPVIFDANGYADVWLDTGGYKFVLKDSMDVTLWTQDNIDGGSSTGFASNVASFSSGFNLSINEQNSVCVCTASITVSLLPAATAGNGFSTIIMNTSSGNVTIDPDGSELINGASTLVIGAGGSTTITCDGVKWYASGLNKGDGDRGDITVSTGGSTWTIDAGVVTNAKMADMAAATLKGRISGSGTGVPSDITLGNGLYMTSAGVLSGNLNNMQLFSASGTFTPTYTGKVFVEVWGGGGGAGNATGNGQIGGAGGAGGYASGYVNVTSGVGCTVTVGTGGAATVAGGNSSFVSGATTLQANGGASGATSTGFGLFAGGVGGTATGGSLNINGQSGCLGWSANGVAQIGGFGGSSPRGGYGGQTNSTNNGAVGNPGTSPGGGGGSSTGNGSLTAGGAGADGRVVVYYN